MNFYWLIEVVYDPNPEGRSTRYFDGSCDPGWLGGTTLDSRKAQRYETEEDANWDIGKLAPRWAGKWVAVKHDGFVE